MFRSALPPTRSHNSFIIGFGPLNINVSVMTGTESTQVARSEFCNIDGELHPVGRCSYIKDTGEVIDAASSRSVARYAFDADTNTWVLLQDYEVEECTMPKKVAQVITFVPLNKLSANYLTIGLAQVRAKTSGLKGGQREYAERAFDLFLAGLAKKKVAALVKVALRGPAQFAAITPEGDLLWLQPSDGIRQPAVRATFKHGEAELGLMSALIDTIGTDTPDLVDDTAQKVTEYVARKAKNNGVAVASEAKDAPVITDLFAALSGAVDAAKAVK